jgi:hypothetical protein
MNDATLQYFRDLADAMAPATTEPRTWAVCRELVADAEQYEVVRFNCTEAEATKWATYYAGGFAALEAEVMPATRSLGGAA